MIFMPIYWIDNDRYFFSHGDMKKWYRLSWKLVGLRKMLFLCFKVDTAKACWCVFQGACTAHLRMMRDPLALGAWCLASACIQPTMCHGETWWNRQDVIPNWELSEGWCFFDQASLSKSMKRLQSSKAKLFFEHQELGSINDKHIKKS